MKKFFWFAGCIWGICAVLLCCDGSCNRVFSQSSASDGISDSLSHQPLCKHLFLYCSGNRHMDAPIESSFAKVAVCLLFSYIGFCVALQNTFRTGIYLESIRIHARTCCTGDDGRKLVESRNFHSVGLNVEKMEL